jgi:hypothetical protein
MGYRVTESTRTSETTVDLRAATTVPAHLSNVQERIGRCLFAGWNVCPVDDKLWIIRGICGSEFRSPKGYIVSSWRLKPEEFRASFTSTRGWITFSQLRHREKQMEKTNIKLGKLRLKTLAFGLPKGGKADKVLVNSAGKRVRANSAMRNSRVVINLRKEANIECSQAIEIDITFSP